MVHIQDGPTEGLTFADLQRQGCLMAAIIEFTEDEVGYENWLKQNPTGFVFNAVRDHKLLLHLASCLAITPRPAKHWTRFGTKYCSTDCAVLEAFARKRFKHPSKWHIRCERLLPFLTETAR